MSSWRKFKKVGSTIFVLALVTSGCTIRNRIQEGQRVSLDPCNLVSLEKVQSVMGGPIYQMLDVRYTPEGEPFFEDCAYMFPDAPQEGLLILELLPETYKDARDIHVGEGGADESAKPLKDLGREARYRSRKDESSASLDLVVLSSKGAKLGISITLPNADEPSLLAKARALATPALARIEKMFPGTESPPTDKGPIPVCLSVGPEGLAEIYKPLWPPASPEAVGFQEELQVGGPPKAGFGPVGGGWICEGYPDPPNRVRGDDLPPGFVWWISKVTPPAEAPAGSQQLRGLGAAAFWRVDDGWWYSRFPPRSGTLTVFTKGGHHLEVEVSLKEGKVDESLAKGLATAAAERIVAKLP
ncbi:MAG: hypothetical protein KY429_11555 [Actinobacteria bacterium]|nr:hypothetical protein [Actinomycetota bacterium]